MATTKHAVPSDRQGGQVDMFAERMQILWTLQRLRAEKMESILAMVWQIAIQCPRQKQLAPLVGSERQNVASGSVQRPHILPRANARDLSIARRRGRIWGLRSPEECGPRLTPGGKLKVAAEFPFEAVLGKTRRTEF